MSTQYTQDTLIDGATALPWRLEVHEHDGTHTLLVRNIVEDFTVLEEPFAFAYPYLFGVDVVDRERMMERAEEAITAWEEGQE